MRLPRCKIAFLLCCSLAALSCGPGRVQSNPNEGYIYPVHGEEAAQKTNKQNQPSHSWISSAPPPDISSSAASQNKNYFVIHVDKEGLIHLGDSIVTEKEFLNAAKEALQAVEDVVAIILVESGMTQGIHLSAELSNIGYKNVQVYYPTATNR